MGKNIKIFVLGLSLLVVVLPSVSSAQTVEGLKAQIAALLAQIQELQAQLAKLQGGEQAWCHTFSANLGVGSSGDDVAALRIVLQKEGFDVGQGTNQLDETVASAVTGFQEKYHEEILASVGLKYGTGFVGKATRAKLNALYGCGATQPPSLPTEPPRCIQVITPAYNPNTGECKEFPTPCEIPAGWKKVPSCAISQPITTVKVVSPNGGEQWGMGTVQAIRWLAPASSAASVRIYLTSSYTACDIVPCPASPQVFYEIVQATPNDGLYEWTVGKNASGNALLAGKYMLAVQEVGTANVDLSDAPFSIISSTSDNNRPPVIAGVSGPTSLSTGQSGTWSVKAYDPEYGTLSYGVDWGDQNTLYGQGVSQPQMFSYSQTATFSHVYSAAGTYTVRFTVSDVQGLTAQTSITVNVEGQIVQPVITVLSPNGGEAWLQSDKQVIKWNAPSSVSAVNITLTNYLSCWTSTPACLAPVSQTVIASNVPNSGSYSWMVNPAVGFPDQYKVTVSDAAGSGLTDTSDEPFSILRVNPPMPTPSGT